MQPFFAKLQQTISLIDFKTNEELEHLIGCYRCYLLNAVRIQHTILIITQQTQDHQKMVLGEAIAISAPLSERDIGLIASLKFTAESTCYENTA